MRTLDFPSYPFNIRQDKKSEEIFDVIRKKYVILTPEEWVRQHCILHLINNLNYPASLMAIEKGLRVNKLFKRTDIVVYGKNMFPKMIIECKAPSIEINNKVFDQIARYNMSLKVNYLMVTNGLQHYCCFIDFHKETYHFLEKIPQYQEL